MSVIRVIAFMLVFAGVNTWLARSTARAATPSLPIEEWKCPNSWRIMTWGTYRNATPYFRCDFTTGTCERGVYKPIGRPGRLFELLDKDRTTVIGHYHCGSDGVIGESCIDFERGISFDPATGFTIDPFCPIAGDLPPSWMRGRVPGMPAISNNPRKPDKSSNPDPSTWSGWITGHTIGSPAPPSNNKSENPE